MSMKRIGILTAGGDTPALNATIHGAVVRANQLKVEVYGLIKGFNSLFNPRVPHVHLNPLFQAIPELDSTVGGTLIGASRDYLNPNEPDRIRASCERLHRLEIQGLICIGGDGTLNLRRIFIERLGDRYFQDLRRGASAREVVFTRKVGHTHRGGRPLLFDRFYAAQLGGKAVELLLEGRSNEVAVLQWNRARSFYLDRFDGNGFRDRWGHIHARQLHPSFYDAQRMRPSRAGIEYLLQIFTHAIGHDDTEHLRETLFAPGNLLQPYHSLNTDMSKRIRYLGTDPGPP